MVKLFALMRLFFFLFPDDLLDKCCGPRKTGERGWTDYEGTHLHSWWLDYSYNPVRRSHFFAPPVRSKFERPWNKTMLQKHWKALEL
jgi:hypothetical protein